MRTIRIRVPMWLGSNGNEAVGLAETKIGDGCIVYIAYKDDNGDKVFPHEYYIDGHDARLYPLQVRKGVPLRIVPISHLVDLCE